MSELKHCPFCGGNNIHRLTRQDYGSYHKQGIRCDDCRFAILYECDSSDEDIKHKEVTEKWNRRTME